MPQLLSKEFTSIREHREAKSKLAKISDLTDIQKKAARTLVAGGGGRRKPQKPRSALLVDQRQPHYLYNATIVLEVK
jgi:hypothetical protein